MTEMTDLESGVKSFVQLSVAYTYDLGMMQNDCGLRVLLSLIHLIVPFSSQILNSILRASSNLYRPSS
jgi:hypothetical protein